MYVLVEYSDNLKGVVEEIKKHSYLPVVLFKMLLSNKVQIKDDLEKLMILKKEVKSQFKGVKTGVLVEIASQDNSTVGIVNGFKREFDVVIGQGGLNKLNRFFLESTRVDFLLDPQSSKFKVKIDFIHHFNSGLNHVLCEYAKKKEIGFVFSLNFFNGNKKYVPKEIGRINQNLRFARKYKIGCVMNFIVKDVYDVKSLIALKGIYSFFNISTNQIVEATQVLGERIEKNEFEMSEKFVKDGIEFA